MSHAAAKEYHGAGFNDGEDAAEDSRADEQLPLLAQMQVNVVQDHRQQNAPRLWKQGKRKPANKTLHVVVYSCGIAT